MGTQGTNGRSPTLGSAETRRPQTARPAEQIGLGLPGGRTTRLAVPPPAARGEQALLRSMSEALGSLQLQLRAAERRQQQDLRAFRRELRRRLQEQATAISAQRQAMQAQKSNDVIASAQAAAIAVAARMGEEQPSLFGQMVLLLASNQLIWTYLPDLVDAIERRPDAMGLMRWLGPAGNALVAEVLLRSADSLAPQRKEVGNG